jgi:hypothetical protein
MPPEGYGDGSRKWRLSRRFHNFEQGGYFWAVARDDRPWGGRNGLVSCIPVAMHDVAIVLEKLERVDRAATRSVGVGDGRGIGPVLGDVEESASQMGPAEGECDRLVARSGPAPIAGEALERIAPLCG